MLPFRLLSILNLPTKYNRKVSRLVTKGWEMGWKVDKRLKWRVKSRKEIIGCTSWLLSGWYAAKTTQKALGQLHMNMQLILLIICMYLVPFYTGSMLQCPLQIELYTTTVTIDYYHVVCLEGIFAPDHACPSWWGSEMQTRYGHEQLTGYWLAL